MLSISLLSSFSVSSPLSNFGQTSSSVVFAQTDNTGAKEWPSLPMFPNVAFAQTAESESQPSDSFTINVISGTQCPGPSPVPAGQPNVDDTIYGTDNNDASITGDSGNDNLFGCGGDDTVRGGQGNDNIDGGDGNDDLFGDQGNDNIIGENGDDEIFGGSEDDDIDGGNGNDKIFGEGESDEIVGGDGNDEIDGGAGNDELEGGAGNDKLLGQNGNDEIIGGEGNDEVTGGNGNDVLTGGLGADKFDCGSGTDRITDFNAAEGDTRVSATACELSGIIVPPPQIDQPDTITDCENDFDITGTADDDTDTVNLYIKNLDNSITLIGTTNDIDDETGEWTITLNRDDFGEGTTFELVAKAVIDGVESAESERVTVRFDCAQDPVVINQPETITDCVNDFVVNGTANPGASITLHEGDVDGPVLGTATADETGFWEITLNASNENLGSGESGEFTLWYQ